MFLAAATPDPRMAAGLYVLVVLVGGTALLVSQTMRDWGKPPPLGVPGWRANWPSFLLWLWFIFIAYLLGGIAVRALFPAPPGTTTELLDQDPNSLILRATAMEVLLVAVQLVLLVKGGRFSPAPVNREPLPAAKLLRAGFLGWLAAYPIILLTALGWKGVLAILRHWVPNLETPQQDPILLLLKTHEPGMLVILLMVAVVLAPMNEELLFRAGFYRFFKGQIGRRGSLVLVNLGFALAHGNVLNFLPLLVVGLLLTRVYERSGHVAVPIIFHACFNLNTVILLLLAPNLVDATQSVL